MKKVLTVILLLFASQSLTVFAEDETWLHLGMVSHHLSSKDYNERHRLIALEHNSWAVGYYNNSYNRDSFFIFKSYEINYFDKYLPSNAKFKLKTGIISGYAHVIDGVMPAIIPTLSFNHHPVSFDFNMLGNVYSIEFKIKLR